MKRLMSVILLIAVLVLSCACAKQTDQAAVPAATLDPGSPEAMFGHIDQTHPVEGVYKIWNSEGVRFMLQNPGNSYELLCQVDLEGAVIAPVGELTGTINGSNFTISNFTVQGGEEENFGFISVNKGSVKNLYLENVTLQPGENAKNIGALVGDNQGTVLRCTISGAMCVENAPLGTNCGSLAGISTGKLQNTKSDVNVRYTAAGKANVGGIAGQLYGGIAEYNEVGGAIDVTDCGEKSVGLFAGSAEDVVITGCVFLGASNTQDGKLFVNFTGNEEDDELAICPDALWRDNYKEPLTPGQEKLRDRVVEEMNNMATVEWHLHEDLVHTCTCTLSSCHGVYNTTYTYYGIPYNHKGGSLDRMLYALDEEGYIQDWLYDMESFDGFDGYIGNDCSTALIRAWWTVSNSVDFSRVKYQIPVYFNDSHLKSGCIPVGTGWWEDITSLSGEKTLTQDYITINGEQKMMEAYAQMRKGDGYAYFIDAGGHTRMAVEDPVVVRDQQGQINSTYSYVITTEQGSTTVDEINGTFSSWKYKYKYTFGSLLENWAVPITCEELLSGEMETPHCAVQDGADGYAGMYTGTVKSNYYLDSVVLELKDSQGNVVLDHKMYTSVGKNTDQGHPDGLMRIYLDEFDLAMFIMPLSKIQLEKGQTYSYTITGNLQTYDSFVVKEDSFIYGQA